MGRRRLPAVWLLATLGGLAVCIQHVTVVKLSAFSPGSSHVSLPNFLRAVEQKVVFSPLDGLLAALFLLGTVLLLYQEARHRVLTEFLQDCFASAPRTFWLLTGSLLVCLRYYLAAGDLSWGGDASHHIAHSWLAARAIADGQVPIWTFFIGTGSPVFQTYGFAFYYLLGLVDLAVGDLVLSLKLVMAAAHVLSGIGMYLLASTLCRSRPAGFIAGLAYALCFWHTQHVLLMGRLPLSLFYALLPWAFYWIEQVVDSERRMRAALPGGACLALLAFTHPGYGAFAMALAGCYSLVRLWSCRRYPDRGGRAARRTPALRPGHRLRRLHEPGHVLRARVHGDARLRHGSVGHSRPDLAAPAGLVEPPLLADPARALSLVRRLPGDLPLRHGPGRRGGPVAAPGGALRRLLDLPDPQPPGRRRLPPAAGQLAAADPLLQRVALPALRRLLPGPGRRRRRPHAPAPRSGARPQPTVHAPAPGDGPRSLPHHLHSALLPPRGIPSHRLGSRDVRRSLRGGLRL